MKLELPQFVEKLQDEMQLTVVSEVAKSVRTIVYHAKKDNRSCTLKIPRQQDANSDLLWVQYHREASFLARLDHPSLPKSWAVGRVDRIPYLVSEFIEGTSLAELIKRGPLSQDQVLVLATSILSALEVVHRHGLVHRDIKPENIIVKPGFKPVLIDFGFAISQRYDQESEELVGTLQYCAPEQSGIIKRPVDRRSDLYAFGVVLYECIAGTAPFLSNNPAKLLHLHASQPPKPLRELRPDIPHSIESLILKLLAKDPDDRFQNAHDVLQSIDSNFHSDRTTPEQHRPEQEPETEEATLVGREKELSELITLWELTCSKTGQISLIEGESGSGKTRLIREFLRRTNSKKSLILQSKCGQKNQLPFGALKEALLDYWENHNLYSDESSNEELKRIVIAHSDALRTFAPSLESKVLGTEGTRKNAKEYSQDQIYQMVADFFISLTQIKGSLLLFIDDVQWLDEASFQVVRRMVASIKTTSLFLLLAARTSSKENTAILSSIKTFPLSQLNIGPLTEEQCSRLIAKYLGSGQFDARLTNHVFLRSKGNPFAISEYLHAILDNGLLRPWWGEWILDLEGVDHLQLPNDLIQLILRRLEDLDLVSLEVLSTAALVSQKQFFSLLPTVCEVDKVTVERVIEKARIAHLIEKDVGLQFTFAHDRIQEALIQRITDERLRLIHQKIAEALSNESTTKTNSQFTYAIAQHYFSGQWNANPSKAYAANLAAARTALAEYAVGESFQFFEQAEVLAAKTGEVFDARFFGDRAQACVLTGRTDEAIPYLLKAIELSDDSLFRANTRVSLARVYIAKRQIGKTWDQVNQAFSELGTPLSHNIAFLFLQTIWHWFTSIKFSVFGKPKQPADVERQKTLVQCYECALQASYFTQDLVSFLCFGVQSLKPATAIGISRELAFSYTLYGLNFAFLRLSRLAEKYSDKAISVAKKSGDRLAILRSKIFQVIIYNFDGRWKESERLMGDLTRETRWMDSTDFLNMSGCLMFQNIVEGSFNKCLSTIDSTINQLKLSQSQSVNTEDEVKYHPYFSYQMLAFALSGNAEKATDFIRNCKKSLEMAPDDNFGAGLYYSCIVGFCYETRDYGKKAEDAIAGFKGVTSKTPLLTTIHTKHFYAYQAYIRMEQLYQSTEENHSHFLKLLKSAVWDIRLANLIPNCPGLQAHQFVVEAALLFHQKRFYRSLKQLEKAEHFARRDNCALARFEVLRLRARILKSQGALLSSTQEAQLAYTLAKEFGWFSRMNWIRKEFEITPSQMLISYQEGESSQEGIHRGSLQIKRHEGALLKVGLAAGSKIDPMDQARSALDELIKALGAERAFMFAFDETKKSLSLVMGRAANGAELSELEQLSQSVLDTVVKTRKPLIVSADESGDSQSSDSILFHDLKSIIAAPMLLEEHFEGVIYLDNRFAKGVFSDEDLRLLQSIGNQIALARKSARTVIHLFEKKQLVNNLNKFLPLEVANEIVSGNLKIDQGPRHLAITVLFSDLVGFTKILSGISASDSSLILNRYLDRMINVIFEHGGTIDKFIGDAIMVIFGAPMEIPPHEQVAKAVACAEAMQEALKALNEDWRRELGISAIEMRIGIHHGPALIGNFGNEQRMQYTAFGNTVNLSARIQSVCTPGHIYFSQIVCDYLKDLPVKKVGAFELKGIDGPINIYETSSDTVKKKAA